MLIVGKPRAGMGDLDVTIDPIVVRGPEMVITGDAPPRFPAYVPWLVGAAALAVVWYLVDQRGGGRDRGPPLGGGA